MSTRPPDMGPWSALAGRQEVPGTGRVGTSPWSAARGRRVPQEDSAGSLGAATEQYGMPVALAALVIAGGAIAVVPQHAVSILRLLLATIAVALLGLALRPRSGTSWTWEGDREWESIFEREGRRRRLRSEAVPGLASIHHALVETRAPVDGPPLPAEARRRLLTVAAAVLDREGIDVFDPAHAPRVQARLSPAAWSVLQAAIAPAPPRTIAGRHRTVKPADTARWVHQVLDELQQPGRDPGRPAHRGGP